MTTPTDIVQTAFWLQHEFRVYLHSTDWYDVGGVYIFAGPPKSLTGNYAWQAFYIGQTESFANRILSHEKWWQAVLLGATHVHAYVEQGLLTRQSIEGELIRKCQPPLNFQHRYQPAG